VFNVPGQYQGGCAPFRRIIYRRIIELHHLAMKKANGEIW